MSKVNLYLFFDGETEAAFNFYRSVFGGEFATLVRNRDVSGEVDMPNAVGNEIANITLPLGENIVLVGGDLSSTAQPTLTMGDNLCISFHPDSAEEADDVFRKLSAGGRVEMSLGQQPWGDYYGSLVDKFGIWWMVNYLGQAH